MKIHQQRVPIISPLDKDYHPRSLVLHGLGSNRLSSFRDERSEGIPRVLNGPTEVNHEDGGGEVLAQRSVKPSVLFTIVGERDI